MNLIAKYTQLSIDLQSQLDALERQRATLLEMKKTVDEEIAKIEENIDREIERERNEQ